MVTSRMSSAMRMKKDKVVVCGEHEDQPVRCDDMHVLAVDDCLIDRKVIEKLLKTNFFKVTTVDSAERALEILGFNEDQQSTCVGSDAFKVNMIITDYCMPGMTGYDLLKKVKETKCLKEIPVVIISSENVPQRITSCLAEGAKDFIIKPLKLADVTKLKGHIKLAKNVASASASASGPVSSNKRKISSTRARGKISERRPRLDDLTSV